MTGSGMISWHRVMKEVEEPLDAIAREVNATTTAVSCYATRKLPKALLRHGKDKLLYLMIGYLIAKIEEPRRRLGCCKIEEDGGFYVSWTVD